MDGACRCTVVKHILYSRRQCGMLIESLKNVLEEASEWNKSAWE